MHVVFVEPSFPRNQREFVRALHAVGASVTAIGEGSAQALDPELKSWLDGYEQVPSVTNGEALLAAVKRIQSRGWVDRLETTVEAHIMPCAWVREQCTIPGTSTRTAWLCRDKPAMKEALREAGVATAESLGTNDPAEARAFAKRVGFPVILKPRDGAGAAGTYRANDEASLEAAIQGSGLAAGAGVACEEFIEGHEGFYDTLTVGGHIVHDFVSHYYPNVLEAMRERWISPQIVATNRVDADDTYDEVKALGRRVQEVLGVETSATHMEWFFGPKGLKFSEIGCRPPGVRMWDVYAAANEIDIYREWAQLIVHGAPAQRLSRRYAAGMVALRPSQDGRIVRYEGQAEMQRRYGQHLMDSHFPEPGTRTQGVEAGYHANAWVRARHESFDELRAMLDWIGENVRVIGG
ncbi:Alanine-anticapsin ligase BacD [Planctomycetes bacterium Poly30]|uniref:Alanine-anticapsin ligase BacD n=1 Tax=Saltatorellus ferox TaxID=2528018 RepID=A0A518ETV4_9BACT|nr:Alanine-anticapsin ligase BacD [Planctomycetes bacterium Poly30]